MSESGELTARRMVGALSAAYVGGLFVDVPTPRPLVTPDHTAHTVRRAPAPHMRVASVDVVRGLAMVLMALDHVRDYVTDQRIRPEDLSRATAALFATRWVTHFCAPTFFLLAGVGIGLLRTRLDAPALRRWLVVRGLWLLVLELIITPVGWQFGVQLVPAFALVLWALGWSMIVLAVCIALPPRVLAVASLAMIAGHNLLDGIAPAQFGAFAWVWHFLHVPGFVVPGTLFVGYPLVPWVAVMALGTTLAPVFTWAPARRRAFFTFCGLGALALFVVLRAMNGYGNPAPWSVQRSVALTVASFLNVNKYPPSLEFLLMANGATCIALALAESARGFIAQTLAVYGRVPLFYYVMHIVVAHVVAMSIAFAQGGVLRRVPIIHNPDVIPASYGVPLWGVYVAWAVVVAALWWPCVALGRRKATRNDWWLRFV